jgi:DNA-binding HxlR family transcriptional regulator
MTAFEILQALRGQRAALVDLRSAAGTLGMELARGVIDASGLLEEIAWVDVSDEDQTYLMALQDLVTAFVAERHAISHEHETAAVVSDALMWRILHALLDGPLTATQVARTLMSDTSTIHRRLKSLEDHDLVVLAERESKKDKPYALTPRALVALAGRDNPAESAKSAERADLAWCVQRPVQHLNMAPHERTLYWALLHWAGELLARSEWSMSDGVDARDLRRMLVALGQPRASDGRFAPGEDHPTRRLLDILWRYRDLDRKIEDDLEFEREFAAAAPIAGHPGSLAWAIAAIRVAHGARMVAERNVACRGHARQLERALRGACRERLAQLTVPLAVFWRDLVDSETHRDDVDHALAAAELGVDSTNPVAPALALCREHLRVVARSNRAWVAIDGHLKAMFAEIRSRLEYAPLEKDTQTFEWIRMNRPTIQPLVEQYIASHDDLVTAVTDYLGTVQLELEGNRVATIRGDLNLVHYQTLCTEILVLKSMRETPKPEPRVEIVPGPLREAGRPEVSRLQIGQLEAPASQYAQAAVARAAVMN